MAATHTHKEIRTLNPLSLVPLLRLSLDIEVNKIFPPFSINLPWSLLVPSPRMQYGQLLKHLLEQLHNPREPADEKSIEITNI